MRASGSVIAAVVLAAALAACGTASSASQAPAAPASSGAPAAASGTATASTATVGTASQPPAARPSPAPTLTGPATLTAADAGATVLLRVGQRVSVALAPQGPGSWDVPVTTAPTVLARVSAGGGYPSRQPAVAAFQATRPGTATINATTDAACLHAKPACAIDQEEWQVTVVVA